MYIYQMNVLEHKDMARVSQIHGPSSLQLDASQKGTIITTL